MEDSYEDDFEEYETDGGSRKQGQGEVKCPNCIKNTEAEAKIKTLQLQISDLETKLNDVTTQLRRERVRGRRANSRRKGDDEPTLEVATTSSFVPEIRYSDVRQGDQVSGGGFSVVYKAEWMSVTVAVKRIFDPKITKELIQEFQNEVSMLSKLRHPNIVQILATVSTPPNLCIVCEWMPRGSLHHVLHASKVEISRSRAKSVALQAASAILYMHSRDIIHRDIKPMNFLVDQHLRVKLADFGFALHQTGNNRKCDSKKSKDKEIIGSPPYMAPELWVGENATKASDVYAFGIVLWEIFSGSMPFYGDDTRSIRQTVLKGGRPEIDRDSEETRWSLSGSEQLVRNTWQNNKNLRPKFTEIMSALQSLT
eukprot:CAMPEP_0184496234 /NCGR_PEP_ID=MMETSP0113_2-20130426/33405_1 /TAXON_ID=91329 /ORGANISM="Norrisiella sphaerica, Strain BC52" /LENGTH=367 /DNA_ID=CAMNT_0026882765 /DNA_START=86 /DNA_END=1185 /DNA_ORIENTATION=+